PVAPSGVQAVFSGIGQKLFVDVTWAPGTDADLAGYNIYRRQGNGGKVKLNPDLIKTPTFRDEDIARGKRYFYSVSAVDLRGNESASAEEAREELPTRRMERVALDEAPLLVPIVPSKIVGVGRNYRDHAKELGNELPREPLIFLKPPSSLIAYGEGIRRPAVSERVDHEGELG